jgi:hypothetical protein
MSKHNKQRREMARLTKDRQYILESNYDEIRKLAKPGHLVVIVVDSPQLAAKHFGSKEAGENFQAYCLAKGTYSLAWLVIPWHVADESLRQSHRYPEFKELACRMGDDQYVPACVINGADGVGVGYGFGIVPKGECAGMIYDRKEYRNGVEIRMNHQ